MTVDIYWVTRYRGDPPEAYKVLMVNDLTGARFPAIECCCVCADEAVDDADCPCYGLHFANPLSIDLSECPCSANEFAPDGYLCFYEQDLSGNCVWQGSPMVGSPGTDECYVELKYYPNPGGDPYWILTIGTSGNTSYFFYYGEWDCASALVLTCSGTDPDDNPYDYCNECNEDASITITPGYVKL